MAKDVFYLTPRRVFKYFDDVKFGKNSKYSLVIFLAHFRVRVRVRLARLARVG